MWEERYLKYFDFLFVAGRTVDADSHKGLDLSSGENVKHIELQNIDSIKNFKNRKNVRNKLVTEIKKNNISVIISRLPSSYGLIAIDIAKKLNIPYVIEMVGDPFDAYWNHGKILGKFYAPFSYFQYRKVLKSAKYSIFVTEHFLQNKYASNKSNHLYTNISNVNLIISENHLKPNKELDNKLIKIGLIGSYSSKYKGIDTAIKALKRLNETGLNAKLYVLGSGDRNYFKPLISELGIEKKVEFVRSKNSGEEVFDWLRTLDIYIQPSLTEGLPRALIEAMSVGLPSIGTNVGGIPELLDNKMLIDKHSDEQLYSKILKLVTNKELYEEQSCINANKARDYTKDHLESKRDDFWREFKNMEDM